MSRPIVGSNAQGLHVRDKKIQEEWELNKATSYAGKGTPEAAALHLQACFEDI